MTSRSIPLYRNFTEEEKNGFTLTGNFSTFKRYFKEPMTMLGPKPKGQKYFRIPRFVCYRLFHFIDHTFFDGLIGFQDPKTEHYRRPFDVKFEPNLTVRNFGCLGVRGLVQLRNGEGERGIRVIKFDRKVHLFDFASAFRVFTHHSVHVKFLLMEDMETRRIHVENPHGDLFKKEMKRIFHHEEVKGMMQLVSMSEEEFCSGNIGEWRAVVKKKETQYTGNEKSQE